MAWLQDIRRRMFSPTPLEVAQASLAAINGRDWDTLAGMLADDFYFQEGESRIDGAGTYLAAIKEMVEEAGDFELLVDDFSVEGNVVTMRGSSHATSHNFRTAAVWRLEVVEGKVAYLQNYRSNNHARLSSYAKRRS